MNFVNDRRPPPKEQEDTSESRKTKEKKKKIAKWIRKTEKKSIIFLLFRYVCRNMPKCIQSDLEENGIVYIVQALVCVTEGTRKWRRLGDVRGKSGANVKSPHTQKDYLNKLRWDMRGCCLLLIINHSESSRFRYITCRIHIFPFSHFIFPWDYCVPRLLCFPLLHFTHLKVNLYLFNLKVAEKGAFYFASDLVRAASPFSLFEEVNYDIENLFKNLQILWLLLSHSLFFATSF